MSVNITKMKKQTIRELTALAKEQDLSGCYKLKKADLITLLQKQSLEAATRSVL